MSNLSNLKPAKGAIHKQKRIARGQGSGHGGTATKGHKGQQSRSGYSRKKHHEGGQTPLQMRIPKRGFNNRNKITFKPLNLSDLEYIATKHDIAIIDFDVLRKLGMVKKTEKVKVLGNGDVSKALEVNLHAFSESAKSSIEASGGSVSII
ncbi:MAG: 50S ribosomal protein L15 [Chitinophagales bacterium]